MKTTKKLSRALRDLVALLEDESARNPAFAQRLEEITVELPGRFRRRPRKQPVSVPDVLAEYESRGPEGFRFWLRDFEVPVLKAIVKRNGFDPARLSQKWLEPDKFVNLICGQVMARAKRGSAFQAPDQEKGRDHGEAGMR
jgi:hypothetical protein